MYKDERDIYYYDAVSYVWNRTYKGLDPFPHYELAKVIKKTFDNGNAEHIRKGTKQSTYITAMRVYKNCCEILIGFADTIAADPTLNDRPAKKRRVIQKVGNEGLEHSAHIIWHYETKNNNGRCSFYLEGAIGLSSIAITRFFNRLLRLYAKDNKDYFSAPDPEGAMAANGKYKRILLRPRIELHGHPSQEFIRDLKQGALREIELYTEAEQKNPWDANAYGIEERKAVIIKPNKDKLVPKAKALLDGILKKEVTQKYEYARIVFKTNGDVTRSVRVHSENYNLVSDNTYVKKDRVKNLGGNLPNAFNDFHREIIFRMRNAAGI